MNYIEPVFRPPSEWQSLIIQVSNGCSWNRCTFCDMYQAKQKRFSVKSLDDIRAELSAIAAKGISVRRVFLADGDAMTLSIRRLRDILLAIREFFPEVQRISSYCLPQNLSRKSIAELSELRQLGLSLMYVGCETGDDQLLEIIDKGESFESSLSALEKIRQAGMKSSVMILNGLGGSNYSHNHVRESARLMNAAQPDYLSTLVVNFAPDGEERFAKNFAGQWQKMQQQELFAELHALISQLDLNKTIFRSDHISNTLVLKGVLGRDQQKLLTTIKTAMQTPELIPLRPERQRAL